MTHRCVVMVSPNFHPYVGGAEKQALELSKALREEGVWVRVLTRRKGDLPRWETISGVEVLRLAAWGHGLVDSLVFMASSFWWLLRHRGEYHAVHVHLAGSPALSAAVAGRLSGRPVVIKIGGGRGIGELAASSRTWAGRLKLKALAALKPQFATVTKDLVAELSEHGLGEAPVVVVPNGVDTKRYHPVSPAERASLRTALGWPAGPCFLYVGRLSAEKRLSFFLDAFSEALREAGAQAFFAMIGAGPEEERLQRTIEARSLQQNARIHAPTSEIAGAYSAADVFVLPSQSEGLSNALLEAMSSGCAVLASRVGGTPEAVRDGESGFLFDPMDAKALKTGISRLMLNPDKAAEMGRKAREEALARFDVGAVARRYRELYKFNGEREG
ncbi:MAG: glycosyltransferase family 4 protein [Elusimicrobia bacterium]|nr:glycosyltransferase family 4 protein [Elusimicrobiota bacterium]